MPDLPDQERFLALVEEHKRILYWIANLYCRNRADRDDLIQDIVSPEEMRKGSET